MFQTLGSGQDSTTFLNQTDHRGRRGLKTLGAVHIVNVDRLHVRRILRSPVQLLRCHWIPEHGKSTNIMCQIMIVGTDEGLGRSKTCKSLAGLEAAGVATSAIQHASLKFAMSPDFATEIMTPLLKCNARH